MKVLLLDIDYTLFDGATPRPYLKEFIEAMHKKYKIHFYTAGTRQRVAEVLRILKFQLNIETEIIYQLDRECLTRENCNTIELKNGATVKCLQKAADELGYNVEDLILLDDNPSYDNPHVDQIIQAEGFMSDMENDDYLLRLISEDML